MSKRKKRLILLGVIVVIVIGVVIVARVVLSETFLAPRVERMLSTALGARCRIKGLHVGLGGRITSQGLTISADDQGDDAPPFVSLEGINIDYRVTRLLLGRLRLTRVQVSDFTLDVTPGVVEWISELSKETPPETGHAIGAIPPIELERGVVNVALPDMGKTFALKDVTCRFWQDQWGDVRAAAALDVNGNPFSVEVAPGGAGREVVLRIESPGLVIQELPQFKVAEIAALSDTTVSGRIRGGVTVHVPVKDGGKISLDGAFFLQGVDASAKDWPVALEDMTGGIEISENGLNVEQVTGRLAGQEGRFRVEDAGVWLSDGKVRKIDVAGTLRSFDLAKAGGLELPGTARQVVEEVGLEAGLVDVDFDLIQHADAERIFELVISVWNGRSRPKLAPVELTEVYANARLRSPAMIEIDSLQCRVGGGLMSAYGHIRQQDDGTIIHDLQIDLTGVGLSDELLGPLPNDVREIVQALGLSDGMVSGKILYGSEHVTFKGDLSASKMQSRMFDYTLEGLVADIRWSSTRDTIILQDVEARHGGSTIRASGEVSLVSGRTADIVLDILQMPLDQELRGLLPEKTRALWDRWRPTGHVDLSVQAVDIDLTQWAHQPESLAGITAVVSFRDVGLTNEKIGLSLEGLDGPIALDQNSARMRGLTGILLGIPFEAGGRFSMRSADPWGWLTVMTPMVRLTPELLAQWPANVGKTLKQLKPEGDFEVAAELRQHAKDKGRIAAGMTVMLYNMAFHLGKYPVVANGSVSFLARDVTNLYQDLKCQTSIDRVTIAGLYGSDLTAQMTITKEDVTLPRLSLRAFGGLVVVEDMHLARPGGKWRANCRLTGVDLESLVASWGVSGKRAPSGVVRANVEAEGDDFQFADLAAKGDIKIDRGHLYDLPVILNVLNWLNLSLSDDSPVSEVYAEFHIQDGKLFLDDALLSGGSVTVHIEGEMTLAPERSIKEQEVNFIFTTTPKKGLLDIIPIINIAKRLTIDKIKRYIFQARLVGTAGDPKLESVRQPLLGPIKGLLELLKKKDDEEKAEKERLKREKKNAKKK